VNKGGFTVYFLDPDDITLEMLQPPAGRPWGSVNGVELNSPQFTPAANEGWAERMPGLFAPEDGRHGHPEPMVAGLGGMG
jgi:hypothetical protein